MKFRREDLQEMSYSGLTEVEETIIEHSRWSVLYKTVFKWDEMGTFYKWVHSEPATEMQEGGWDESPDDLIECPEVQRVEKMMVVYE